MLTRVNLLRTTGRMRDKRVSHKFDRYLTSRVNKQQNIIHDDINAHLLVSCLLSFVIASETAVQVCRNDFPPYSWFNTIILMFGWQQVNYYLNINVSHNFLCTQTASTTSQLFLWSCEVMTRHSVVVVVWGGGHRVKQKNSHYFVLFEGFWRMCNMHT